MRPPLSLNAFEHGRALAAFDATLSKCGNVITALGDACRVVRALRDEPVEGTTAADRVEMRAALEQGPAS